MKFPLAQEVSRHVRDKLCKFYKTQTSATSTITSDNQTSSGSSKPFNLIAINSIKPESLGNEKVLDSSTELMVSRELSLIENNFTDDILSTASFRLSSSNEIEDNEFGMIIEEIEEEEQVVEISFACKLCEFK